jgi:hypothetical protein
LQNGFTADAENVHHLLEDKNPPSSVTFVRLCKVVQCQCWQQSVRYCVSVSSSFVGYSNKLFLREMPTEGSTYEYTTLAPAHHLSNWREQRPSNKGDLDSSVTRGGGGGSTACNTEMDLLLISFCTVVRDGRWTASLSGTLDNKGNCKCVSDDH